MPSVFGFFSKATMKPSFMNHFLYEYMETEEESYKNEGFKLNK